jgi:SET domain-containing protein
MISLFGFKSFINHNIKPNIKEETITSDLVFIFAAQDITEGDEIVIDYCEGIKKP